MSRSGALEFLCSLLSLDESPAQIDRLRVNARSGATRWNEVVALASRQWVSAAVWHALQRKGVKDDLPDDLVEYFEGIATLNRQRNRLMHAEAIELTRTLNGVGITPIFLKGAANLLAGLYPDPAQRIMMDLDVLIPAEQLIAGAAALEANGYTQLSDDYPAHHHYPALGRPGGTGSVELHARPLDVTACRFLSADEIIAQAVPLTIEGAKLAVPSAWCRLVHCIAHTQFSDHAYVYGHLSLRELLDTALLGRAEDVDWEAISARFNSRYGRIGLAFHLIGAGRLLRGQDQDFGASGYLGRALMRRAEFQAISPHLQTCNDMLMRPWLLLARSLSRPLLRRRLFRSIFDRTWYARQWRMLRIGKG